MDTQKNSQGPSKSLRSSVAPVLVVMAAGMGSRYGGLKQLDGVGPSGETIMDYSVYNAIQAGFGKVVFIIRHSFEEDFRREVLAKYTSQVSCAVAFQEVESLPEPFKAPKERVRPWGTGHALLMARDHVDTPFCVINADDFYGREAFCLMYRYLSGISPEAKGVYGAVCYSLGNTLSENGTVSRGICSLSPEGNLEKVVEYRKLAKDAEGRVVDEETKRQFLPETPVSMNFWGFTPDYFDYSRDLFSTFLHEHIHEEKSEFYIPSVVTDLLERKCASVAVMQTGDSWFGVTYAEDRPGVVARLAELHRRGEYPTPLFHDNQKENK